MTMCMLLLFVPALLLTSGCTTNLTKPSRAPEAPKVNLGVFENVEMKAVGISKNFASAGANKRALEKIDEVLFREIIAAFPNCKRIEQGDDFTNTSKRTLQITPHIKEIKCVASVSRFALGRMPGKSAVLMQATFCDSSTGEIIANPEFYRDAEAPTGLTGMTDNAMLYVIAQDIVNYCSYNK